MSVLLIAEHDNAELKPATLNALAAAQQMDSSVDILVAGAGCAAVGEAAAKAAGVGKVLVADNAAYANHLPENLAPLVVELAAGYSHVVAAHTTTGKNF